MKISNFKLKIRSHIFIVIFLIFYFVTIAYKLISHPTPFYDWDESINVQVSKEMIENKSLVPLWQGKYWLDKPPLPFLFFGIVMRLTPFISPEISLRITSLILSIIALIFAYAVYLKALGRTSAVEERSGKTAEVNSFVATLIVIITSFTPIFLQRSQIVNLDVFLLIGWLGYLLFVQNFWLSFIFLAIAVLSKSLLGFYPVAVVLGFYIFLKLNRRSLDTPGRKSSTAAVEKAWQRILLQTATQVAFLALWYLAMIIVFDGAFWKQHIIETHFRRVTSSIESHFGQRTYYLDLMFKQLGWLMWLSLIGLITAIINSLNSLRDLTKSSDRYKLLNTFYLLPWFIFLNLSKTKIFWYLYPAIPQFVFFAVYPLNLFFRHSGERSDSRIVVNNNDSGQAGMTIVAIIIVGIVFYQNFAKTNFFTTFYSKPEDHYQLALYAKNHCDSLTVLVGKETRDSIKTLEDLGLTISSTKQWGDHPSMVYYFGKKVDFIYNKDKISNKQSDCLAVYKNDLNLNIKRMKMLNKFDSLYLFKNREY